MSKRRIKHPRRSWRNKVDKAMQRRDFEGGKWKIERSKPDLNKKIAPAVKKIII